VKGYSAQQVRDAEAPHLAAGEPLMERAAAALATECRLVLESEGISPAHARIVVLVGGGNNGGDALFAAATLAARGATVELVRTASRVHEPGLAAALAAGAREVREQAARVAARARSADLIVDGILGTGTSPDPRLRGVAREVVMEIVAAVGAAPRSLGAGASIPSQGASGPATAASGPATEGRRASTPATEPDRRPRGPLVVAVDIPSGIQPDSGEVPEPAAVLPADVTVTVGGAKAGLLVEPAAAFAGEVRLVDIGLAAELARLTPLIDS
jgi:NAD(P)H-hydrate epimerase